MKKHKVALVVTALSFALLIGFGINRSVNATRTRLNVKDQPKHQLTIIAPTDPIFEKEFTKLPRNGEETEAAVETRKAFSVFLVNESKGEVIAYRLRWDLVQQDGSVTSHFKTYAEPGALMGRDFVKASAGPEENRAAIAPSGLRYISLLPDSPTEPSSHGVGSGSAAGGDEAAETQLLQSKNSIEEVMTYFRTELANSQSVTVTLDAAIFGDGGFVGPDALNYFGEVNGMVNAKKDLLRDALETAQQKKSLLQFFDRMKQLTDDQSSSTGETSPTGDYQKLYKKEFAAELLRLRAAGNTDEAVVWHATRAVYRKWPTLHKRQ